MAADCAEPLMMACIWKLSLEWRVMRLPFVLGGWPGMERPQAER